MTDQLLQDLLNFRKARDWKQFHDPKSLAASIAIEAAELLEHFQWATKDQARQIVTDKKQAISEELADILIYLSYFAHDAGIDLNKAVADKVKKNAAKYPEDKSKGTSTKYTELK